MRRAHHNPEKTRCFIRVTPYQRWTREIRKVGLVPHVGHRGGGAEQGDEPRVYLFEDEDTADDAMMRWLLDLYGSVRYFAILRVCVPASVAVYYDPEIAGSFYVTRTIPAANITLLRREDAGEVE